MKYKILVIVNPKAGKGKFKRYIPELKEKFEKKNYEIDIIYTTIDNNATMIIEKYEKDIDIVIVCGGDGTLNEVVQGIYKTNKKVFLGYIPSGTTNDFAKSINVSFDKMDIANKINEYDCRKVDIGIINEKNFIFAVTFGIFSSTSYKVTTKWKNRIGRLAYFLYGVTELFNYKTYKLKIKVNEEIIEDEFVFGSVSNSNYVGGFHMYKNDEILLDDGYFEILLVKKPKNFIELLKLSYKVMNGNLSDENIYSFKANNLCIESENDMEIAIDGEYGGNLNKICLSNINQYVDFITPKSIEK